MAVCADNGMLATDKWASSHGKTSRSLMWLQVKELRLKGHALSGSLEGSHASTSGKWYRNGKKGCQGLGGGECLGRAQRTLRAVTLHCMAMVDTCHYTLVQTQRTHKVTSNVNCELWLKKWHIRCRIGSSAAKHILFLHGTKILFPAHTSKGLQFLLTPTLVNSISSSGFLRHWTHEVLTYVQAKHTHKIKYT